MLRADELLGVIVIRRDEVRPFTDSHIALIGTFADQAAIAIENARLLTELQAKNADLTEALEQQTATAEILRVISSSPTDLRPVLDAVAQKSAQLCEADDAVILTKDGDALRVDAHLGAIPLRIERTPYPLNRRWVSGRAVLDRQAVHVHDLAAAADEFPEGQAMARIQGHRTTLAIPLLREGEAIGAILIRRDKVRPFSEKHIALLATFADQAVIAIENVRLFTELESKNRALAQARAQVTKALEQQTTTSDILRVISSSPTDIRPVAETIAEHAGGCVTRRSRAPQQSRPAGATLPLSPPPPARPGPRPPPPRRARPRRAQDRVA